MREKVAEGRMRGQQCLLIQLFTLTLTLTLTLSPLGRGEDKDIRKRSNGSTDAKRF